MSVNVTAAAPDFHAELNFAPRSQQEARALASMVVASLPFPPLPVMVLQGEDGEDGLASSFDLLHTAVLNAQLNAQLMPADRDAAELARSKAAVLQQLQRDMAALHASSFGAEFPDGQAYDLFCGAFREYLLKHYATSTHDLRFYPLHAVAADSVLVQQGSSHWNASRMLSGQAQGDACGGARFSGYRDVVRAYALDLATLEHE